MARWVLKFASWKRSNDIFEAIKLGKTTIETRPNNLEKKRNYSQVKPGDTLILCSLDTEEKIEKKASFVHVYKSIQKMANSEPVNKIIPGVRNPNELVQIFEELKKKWGKDYARKLENYGIVVIGME